MAALQTLGIADVVDLARYPLDRLASPAGQALVTACRKSLAASGSAELPGFLQAAAIEAMVEEALRLAPDAHRSDDTHNVFFDGVPPDAEPGDPQTLLQHSSKLTVAWDHVAETSALRLLYNWDPLTRFLAEALELAKLHRYADPLAACSLAVFEAGDELGWHFDRAAFAVTVMLQPGEYGGDFDFVPRLRPEQDGDASELVAQLGGAGREISRLTNDAGTLSLFRGHRSLHRVTPVSGATPRINAVLAYSEHPAERMNALTQQLFYGRVAAG